ncbi:MAG: fluoride efflux transporter CrcB [Haloarculaceae archaeon]
MVAADPAQLVGAGGALGALLRHLVGELVDVDRFPVGTLTVNVVGSFVLALVTFLGSGSDVALFVGTGACGSFTTFSSFSFQTVRLWESGDKFRAGLNAGLNLAGALLGVGLAWAVASLV